MTLGLFLLSAATTLFEVVLTRVFSVALWGPFAFLVVSLAMLGFGASGSLLHLFPSLKNRLGTWFLLFWLAAGAVYLRITWLPFDPVKIAWDPFQFLWLSLFYILASVPFFFSGLFIGGCLTRFPERSGRLYAVNLIGSALGAFLSLLFLSAVPLSAARISPYKALSQALFYPGSQLLATQWGPEARIDILKSGAVRFAPGLSLQFLETLPEQLGITLDGDRMNAATRWDGDPAALDFFSYLPSAAPYALLKQPEVLVIESGGGFNILEAIAQGARGIVALERNRRLVELLKKDFPDFSAYSRDGVEWVADHARHFLARCQRPFDLIVLSLTDNPGAGATGLYGLNENYLFTREAFSAYLDHLRPGGIFSVTRFLLPPPREEPRALVLAMAALSSEGIAEPFANLAIVESYATWTLLMKRSPFLPEERAALRQFSDARGFRLFASSEELQALIPRDYLFDLSPTSDDRPFFFHFFQISKLRETYLSLRGKWEAFFEAGYLVHFTFVQALFWGLLLIWLPTRWKRANQDSLGGGTNSFRSSLYFSLIGLAFMGVEMAALQKAVFIFGDPTYGIAILLGSLLALSGAGSLVSPWLEEKFQGRMNWIFLMIPAGIGGLIFFKNPIASALLGVPLFFLMGMPFPLAFARTRRDLLPMAWAANAVASVLGAILAVMVALEGGYSLTLVGAGIAYLIAGRLWRS